MEQKSADHLYSDILTSQLGPDCLHIPSSFRYSGLPDHLREMTTPDSLCDLPLYGSRIRHQVFSQLSANIREGRSFAVCKVDSDQLKMANEKVHRQFGDATIRYSAAFCTRILEDLKLSNNPLVFRSTAGGDELYIFFTGLSAEETDMVEDFAGEMNRTVRNVKVPSGSKELDFRLSSSAGLVTSLDKAFSSSLITTSRQLGNGEIPHAFNLIQDMLDKADDRAGAVKVIHELSSLPLKDLLGLNPRQLKNYISTNFGGGRISRAGLNILSMLEQISTFNHLQKGSSGSPGGEFTTSDQTIDIDNPTLRQIVDTYNSIFTKET